MDFLHYNLSAWHLSALMLRVYAFLHPAVQLQLQMSRISQNKRPEVNAHFSPFLYKFTYIGTVKTTMCTPAASDGGFGIRASLSFQQVFPCITLIRHKFPIVTLVNEPHTSCNMPEDRHRKQSKSSLMKNNLTAN